MSNHTDDFILKLRQKPIFSATCASAFVLGFVMPPVMLGAIIVSPVASIALGIVGALNVAGNRSTLSKIFSAAAAVSAGAGLLGILSMASSGGELGAYIGLSSTTLGMAAASGFNLAAYFTRNTEKAQKSTRTNDKNDSKTNWRPPPGPYG